MGDRVVVMRDGQSNRSVPRPSFTRSRKTPTWRALSAARIDYWRSGASNQLILLCTEQGALAINGALKQALANAAEPDITIGIPPEHIVFSDSLVARFIRTEDTVF